MVDVGEQEVRMDEREVRGKVGGGEEGGVTRPHVTCATACRTRKRGIKSMLDNIWLLNLNPYLNEICFYSER
jgi:hypothetical protein